MPLDPHSLFQFGEPRPLELAKYQANLAASFADGSDSLAEAMDLYARARFKPLPAAPGTAPYRMTLADLVGAQKVARIEAAGHLVFHTVGDTGQHGHGADGQESVSFHMEHQIKDANVAEDDKPALFYHLGDVVYFNGELKLYPEQFYEPYQYYQAPIVAIPGNHDGDNVPDDVSLSAFVSNFCTAQAGMPPMPGQSHRLTMTQPNIYFTLQAPFITIIGLYSNTTGDLDDPHGGEPQFDWLVSELAAADHDKFLVIAVHHPPFSADNTHGGEKKIGAALDRAFEQVGRLPHLVLTAHVHDYQRFSRVQTAGEDARTIPYIVAGAGGYCGMHNLHRVYDGVEFPEGVTLEKSNDKLPGFLRMTVSADTLLGEYFIVPPMPDHMDEAHPATLFDSFTMKLRVGA